MLVLNCIFNITCWKNRSQELKGKDWTLVIKIQHSTKQCSLFIRFSYAHTNWSTPRIHAHLYTLTHVFLPTDFASFSLRFSYDILSYTSIFLLHTFACLLLHTYNTVYTIHMHLWGAYVGNSKQGTSSCFPYVGKEGSWMAVQKSTRTLFILLESSRTWIFQIFL